MLRISPTLHDGAPGLRLEGKLVGPWVAECRRAFEIGPAETLRLDLADLDYADAEGLLLLHRSIAAGAQVAACSSFVRELLRAEETP